MSNLNGMTCYLSYPMEAKSVCCDWTKPMTQFLKSIGVNVFNPSEKPFHPLLNDEQGYINDLVANKDWNKLSEVMHEINRIDLRMVDKSDFIIARISNTISTAGAIHEIINADLQKKPVLIFCPEGKEFVNKWLFGFLDHTLFFTDVMQIMTYLSYINVSGFPNNKWTKLT